MNYDWHYRGGGHEKEFWSQFRFTFDRDELEFLRHGSRTAVIPGGRAFHSVRSWVQGKGGYVPYFPEVSLPGHELKIYPPQSGPVFDFLQPVFLTVELFNKPGQSQNLPDWYLNPKGDVPDILIRRIAG